jgi:hypothetical protein
MPGKHWGEPVYTHSDGYEAPFPEEERCAARSTTNKARCKKRRCTGLRVCNKHGGGTQASVDKRDRAKAVQAMKRFVTPIDARDPEANVIVAFELEFRRTIAHIRFFDEMIMELNPEGLGWGISKETTVESSETPGVDTEKLAQANIYYRMQLDERKRLMELVKIWIGAKLDVRKLQIEEQKVDALNNVIEAVLTRLGHNTKDPKLRAVVREEFLALPVAGTPGADVVASAKDILDSPRSLVSEAEKAARRDLRR